MTGAAFLIAAYSIAVSSAHACEDRQEAARIQASKDMAQVRLLTIYPVDLPRQPSRMRYYRIDNRSSGLFFDVSVFSVVSAKSPRSPRKSDLSAVFLLPRGLRRLRLVRA